MIFLGTLKRKLFILILLAALITVLFCAGVIIPPPFKVTFSQSKTNLNAYDFVEITAGVSRLRPFNSFKDASMEATFTTADGNKRWTVQGFCDAADGSVFRVRFMPSTPGNYTYSVRYKQGWSERTSDGSIVVTNGNLRGPVRVDAQNRWHFVWEGTGGHYFFNGTTAYWLMGWRDEKVIQNSIDRLARLKINRMRVTLAGRTNTYFGEPVVAGENWTPLVRPWQADWMQRGIHFLGRLGQKSGLKFGRVFFDFLASFANPDDVYHPAFDYGRFDVSYWQKFDRALQYAGDRDMVISIVLDMNDSQVHPPSGSEDEERFIRYAVARFAAFSNITWDLGDDLDRYRDDDWTRATGTLIKQLDPYKHLATSHPVDNSHQDRTSDWFDFTSFQEWSRNQHAFILAQRKYQQSLGRIIPLTNEEYGYEDHYPLWTVAGYGSESADALRRSAWEIVMAGGYQTAGESARRGTNILPDSGGGWLNGRGDDTMTMFQGYAHMVDFFTSFDWWRAEPHDELVNQGNYCLAQAGNLYAVYLPHGGPVSVQATPGRYQAVWWNAATGEKSSPTMVDVTNGFQGTAPTKDAVQDWALLLTKDSL